jgi:hypothetical protein
VPDISYVFLGVNDWSARYFMLIFSGGCDYPIGVPDIAYSFLVGDVLA